MQILKAFFKITTKLRGSLIMYLSIFITVGVLVSTLSVKNETGEFEASKLNIVVFDNDCTTESKALVDFVSKNHNIMEGYDINDTSKTLDNLYYNIIQYVLTINEGYSENIKQGKLDKLFTYSVDPKSYSYEYFNIQLNQYISAINMYLTSGKDFESAQASAYEILDKSVEVNTEIFTQTQGDNISFKFKTFMLYFAYIIPPLMITILSRIIIELKSGAVKNRTFCSPITSFNYNMQIIAGSIIFCIGIWIILSFIPFFFTGFQPVSSSLLLVMLNSFIFMLVSAGIGILISTFLNSNSFIIDMLANVICLGMSFLCGVFVDQNLLGESVLNISKFLPAYWYVRALENISGANGEVFNSDYVMSCMGIQLLFAAALFTVSITVAKFKKNN